MNGSRLLSGGSCSDTLIKIWSISEVELTLMKEIKAHSDDVCKVIPLSHHRFASCSSDWTVRIWKDDNTYECISTLRHNGEVRSILQLWGKEVLVSAYSGGITPSFRGVSFWNINNDTHQHTIKGYCVCWSTHLIELPNGNIVLSSDTESFPIVIIDSSSY